MKIYIGNDHGGYETKLKIVEHVTQLGHQVIDAGTSSTETVRYPYFAADVCRAVAADPDNSRGILICSTGIGMSIIANKFRGIRAALCTSTYMARMTRRHNNSNVLCLGGKITGIFEIIDMVETWLSTDFDGGRHCISLDLIKEAEEATISQQPWTPQGPRR